jgi:hypothetical protein
MLPFAVATNVSAFHTLTAECPCTACGSGASCSSKDYLSAVVEIPAGQSIVLDDPLSDYLPQPYDPASCIELMYSGENGTCLQPHAFAAGDYTLQVDYDGDQILAAQGLSEGDTQWGQKVWNGGIFSTIDLGKSATQAFSMTDSGGSVHIMIAP